MIALWGGTSPKLDLGPYYGSGFPNANPVKYENIVRDMWCQPCSKYGSKRCPLGHFNCMKKIEVDSIVMKIRNRLNYVS